MNDQTHELKIQRCVDGELPEASQHELFAELEHMPGGWRQLALAFVERQVFQQACGEFAVPPVREAAVAAKFRLADGPMSSFRWTAVAGLLVALGVGFSAGRVLDRRPSGGTSAIALNGQTGPFEAASSEATAADHELPRGVQIRSPAIGSTQFAKSSQPRSALTRLLTLPVGQDGEHVESLQIPVYEPDTLPALEPSEPRVLSADLERRLRDAGYRLDRQSRLLSVPVEHGGSVVVPVKSYGVRYNVR